MIGDGDGNGILHKHGYACLCLCVCVRGDSRDLEAGACFDRVFFLGMLENQFV